ncbi:MAG: ThuA domain-containing protein [Lentisphaerales bacterium]|nr:ThuA domain-containing protein [Lentisphaerales bacterium]
MKKLLIILLALTFFAQAEEKKKVLFLHGKPSHGHKAHEHRAGDILMARRLNESGLVEAKVHDEAGYPSTAKAIHEADTIVIFCTGHKGHILKPHMEEFDRFMKMGKGVVMLHWATEATKEDGPKFLEWMGGFCDLDWSVNPHWTANFKDFPDHPICNGVEPFSVNDEWYYHMRFREDDKGLTPILFDVPPASTLVRKDGPRSGNPHVRKSVAAGEKQTVGWAYQRPGGGRGFAATGGHYHKIWKSDGFRKIMLNAILWTAGAEVPSGGVNSMTPDEKELSENLDPVKKKKKSQK